VVLLEQLKPGEYSQPVAFTDERGKKGVRIIYLISRTEPHRENLKDDYSKIASRALDEKKQQQLEKWLLKNAKTFYLNVDTEYRSCGQIKELFPQITAGN